MSVVKTVLNLVNDLAFFSSSCRELAPQLERGDGEYASDPIQLHADECRLFI